MSRKKKKHIVKLWVLTFTISLVVLAVLLPVLLFETVYVNQEWNVNLQRQIVSDEWRASEMVRGWEVHVSRNPRYYVRPDVETTVININNLCFQDLFLLVIVCSAPGNFELREAIRDTWANLADNATRVAFLMGETDDFTQQALIYQESIFYKDIIQEAFLDSYNNLSIKSVMMLKWLQQECSSARFIMKSDDDVYLNLPALTEALKPVSKSENILVGFLMCKSKPHRELNSKWYTPTYIFHGRFFPNHLSGTGYVMSQDVVPKLYKAALSIPVLHLEDVFVTGICAQRAGVKPLLHRGFLFRRWNLTESCNSTVFLNHQQTPEDLRVAFSHSNNCSGTAPSTNKTAEFIPDCKY